MSRFFILYFLIFITTIISAQELDIRVTGMRPYSIYWNDYQDLDNFNINIINKTNRDVEFEALVSIRGPIGLKFDSKFANCSQSIPGGQRRLYTRNNIDDLCLALKIDDIMPEAVRNDILVSGVLPEGEYEICITAIEPTNNNKVYGIGCFRFNIVHPERPILTNPKPYINNFFDGSITPNFIISWNHSINNSMIRATTTYSIKIIDLGIKSEEDEDSDVHSLLNLQELMEEPGNSLVLFQENINVFFYQININDLNLQDEHSYAVRVYAENDEHPIANDLRSDIGVFELFLEFEQECGNEISFDAVSPAHEAYIPFTQVPLVMKYSPYCDKYIKFWSYTNLTDETTNQLIIDNFERSPRWNFNIASTGKQLENVSIVLQHLLLSLNQYTAPGIAPAIGEINNLMARLIRENGRWKSGGPRRYLNYIINDGIVPGWDADGFYSSHLALNDLRSMPTLVRGHTYTWSSTNMKMLYFRKPVLSASMAPVVFKVGMQAPLLSAPIGGASVDTGIVDFNLKFNNVSASILPPFKIFQIEDEKVIEYAPRQVNEYGVIQVSKSKSFTDNLMAKGIHLQFNEDDFYEKNGTQTRRLDAARLTSELYKDLNFQGRFSDTAMYYWRLGWYNNPDVIPTEASLLSLSNKDFYNITTIDSFQIGNGKVSPPVTTIEVPRDTVCGSSCTISSPINTISIAQLAVNDEILIGKFLAVMTEVTNSGSTFSGKARIKIPFLNNVTIKVNFTNLKVNTNKMVYEGEMIAEAGGTELESIANIVLDQPMQLPLGWDATVKGRHTVLALTQMKFFPTRADLTASINFGDLLPEHMALPEQAELSGTFCFHPGGFSESMIFHLSQDMVFDENQSGYGFQLKGGQMNDTSTMSYIKWDCHGFHSFQIAGDVLLSESLLNKDSGNESNDEVQPGRVKAGFKFKYIDSESANANDNGFILSANIDAFQFKDFEGWGFDSDTIYIDWSDAENPPGFSVPQGYTYPGMNDPQLINGWEGLYIPNLKTFTPKDFGKGVNTRTTFSGSKLFFGEGKYYVGLHATNIFNDSWVRMRAKMDTIQGVISSDEKLIRFKGELLLPFTDTTSWLSYGGHFSGLDSLHLYVAVGGDSVHVQDLPIEFKFDETSLLNIVRGADHTFRANAWFNGVMDLEKTAGHLSSSLSSLSYSGIKFENLGYKSGIGFECGDFSLASPQKTMNGFPIQIDSIDFVNEGGYQGFYFKPKVVLVGDENGFSAAAGMNLLFKFNFAGSRDYISDTKLDLKDVELDVAVSGFELKGRLAFINRDNDKGMEGILAAKLPGGIAAHLKAKFGTVSSPNSNAAFNTADYYSYWYVDGMVTFGATGIPMFAGTNLYGIGGGMWYHMTQNPIENIGYSKLVGTATDTANINYSGIGYTPSYSSHYGMKLQGLFGSQNEGKTFNMLLGVWAQFNSSGGPNVGLDGDMRFMGESVAKLANGDEEATKKSVWGDVHFVYNGQQNFVHGNLNAYVNVTVSNGSTTEKLFYGKLLNDKMTEAEFFAGLAGHTESGKWYLKIGTPEAKAGAIFDLKIKKTDISAYLMVGHGLPNEAPQPDPGFMAMLNNSDDSYIGGDASLVTDKPIIYSATGIAAGILIKDTFAFQFQPFYLDVDAIIGADINVTHDLERKCEGTNRTPGVDGWYGTGQLYAGIQGAFGIEVDLWFIEGRFEFLKGSIALLMQGGLPNPSWFYAKGAFKYKIAGLIEGTHAMQLSVGDKCTIGNGSSPFGDIPIIQDLYPEKNATNVSVYVTPKALVSPSVDQEISIIDVETNEPRIFRVNWKSHVLKKGSTVINTGLDKSDGSEIFMPTSDVLDDNTTYTITIKVSGSEKKSNGWTEIAGFVEERTHPFTTGVMPDTIEENLGHTYPIIGQNYFLKDEVTGSPGFITLWKRNERLLYSSKETTSGIQHRYRYEARFYKGGSTTPIKQTILVENFQTLKFSVASLANNTMYRCKIVRVLDPSATMNMGSQAMQTQVAAPVIANTSVTNLRQEGYKTIGDIERQVVNDLDIRDKNNALVSLNYKIIPQKFMRFNPFEDIPTERVIFEFVFKTSRFNTLTQKIGGKSWSGPLYTINNTDLIGAYTSIEEQFDEIDLQGSKRKNENGQIKDMPPLVQFGSNLQYGEYTGDMYNYLTFDAIANRNKDNELYKLPQDLIEWVAPRSLGLKDAWNNGTLQIRFHDKSLTNPENSILLFEPPLGKEPLSQQNNTVTTAVAVGVNPNAYAVQTVSAEPSSNTSNANFKITLNHGIQMRRQLVKNKSVLLQYASVGNMAWIKSQNASMERRISSYILTPNNGHVECVPSTKMGIIYYHPTPQMGSFLKSRSLTATLNINCPSVPQLD